MEMECDVDRESVGRGAARNGWGLPVGELPCRGWFRDGKQKMRGGGPPLSRRAVGRTMAVRYDRAVSVWRASSPKERGHATNHAFPVPKGRGRATKRAFPAPTGRPVKAQGDALVLTHKSLVADLPNEGQVMEAIEALPHCLHPWRTCRLTAALDPAAEFTHELDHFA